MSSDVNFKSFYLDEALPGHFLLEPSILVAKGYRWIFSPLPEEECDATIETINRIALFIVLPIGALLSALLIPFGLLAIGIGSLCRAPQEDEIDSSSGIVNAHTDAPPVPQTPTTTTVAPPPSGGGAAGVPATPPQVEAVQEVFENARNQISEQTRSPINLRTLEHLKESLLQDRNVADLLAVQPFPMDPDHPINRAVAEYENLVTWIDALIWRYHFIDSAVREGNDWLAPGEQCVKDNGDCLFEASTFLANVNDSNVGSAHQERIETVQWMRRHYRRDAGLQSALITSLLGHYEAEKRRLGEQQANLNALPNTQQQLQAVKAQIDAAQTKEDRLMASIGGDFGAIAGLCEEYFTAMSQSGTHGGSAELYTLSHRHQVCFKIYRKESNRLSENPVVIIGEQYETTLGRTRLFTYTGNHYNPYTPPASLVGFDNSSVSS